MSRIYKSIELGKLEADEDWQLMGTGFGGDEMFWN